MSQIPFVLVTGFLGSGKTTLLRHLAQRHQADRWAFLINDFSAMDVDGKVLSEFGKDLVSIPGGSIFCRCLVTEFISSLQKLLELHKQGPGLDGILIEASGIADPRYLPTMLKETGLDAELELKRVISVIDPGRFCKLVHTLPNIHAQVQASDTLLVNKTDCYGPVEIEDTIRMLREMAPQAEMVQTRYAAWEGDIFAQGSGRAVLEETAPTRGRDQNFYVIEALNVGPISPVALEGQLTILGEALYRCKGFVQGPNGWWRADYASGRMTAVPCDEQEASSLVLMGDADAQHQIDQLATRLKDSE